MKKSLVAKSLCLSASVACLAWANAGVAQDKPAGTQAASADDGTTIVVLGTRRTDRTVTDSASPVDVIGAKELSNQPASDMLDVVKNIVPSFFVGQNSISDASTFVRAPSLRGLPADNILVMLNGKRYNRSPLVQVYTGGDTALSFGSQGADISAIPSIGIASLQILREGATAQYGSDAIGGVLNYGLREDTGVEATARYGQYYDNGGDGGTIELAADVGVKLADRGFINLAGEYYDAKGTSRGLQRPNAVVFAQNNPSLADQLPNYPGPVQIWGSSPRHGYKLLLNSAYEFSDTAKLYLFVNVAHSKADESFNYRPVQTAAGLTANDGSGTVIKTDGSNSAFKHPAYLTPCPTGNATCPAGGFVKDTNTYDFSTLYPAGFTPRFIGETNEAYGTLGLKGTFDSGLTYDVSGSLSRNALALSMTNSLNSSYGPASQTSFTFGKLIQRELVGNADFTYPVEAGLASPITLSWGAEYRQESYEQTAGDEQSYGVGPYAVQPLYVETSPGVYAFDSQVAFPPGASGYGGTSPASAGKSTQRSWGVYGGAETDITSALSVGVAGRYEHYSSFGSAFVGKFNALLHLTDTFALRGTVGTGFHAPSPGQNNVQILTTNFVQGNQVQTGTYPVTSAIAQYYGAKSLSPEKSTNFGLGMIFNPTSDLTVTVDGYSIKVRNRIGITSNFTVSAADIVAQPALLAVGDGGAVNYFTNGFDTLTKGVDVVASYKTFAAGGDLNLTLAYNYNKSEVTKRDPAVINDARVSDIANLAPKHRINASANWQAGPFGFNLRENYYSSWSVQNDYPGQVFGSKFTTDLDISYTFMEKFTLSVGASNLFNTKPDKIAASPSNVIYDITGGTSNGSVYPRSGGPFGFNGGFWYAKVRVKY